MTNQEKIEAYLTDQLTEKEMLDFEDKFGDDPLLREEFSLQQNIITSIKEYRKAQLKQKLNKISVNIGSKYHIVKIASSVIFAVFIGIYVYYNYNIFSPTSQGKEVVRNEGFLTKDKGDFSDIENKPGLPAELSRTESREASAQAGKGDQLIAEMQVVKEIKATETASKNHGPESRTGNPEPATQSERSGDPDLSGYPVPNIPYPDIVDDFGDNEPIHKNLNYDLSDANPAFGGTQTPEQALPDVQIAEPDENDGRFYYRYFNDKLILYGNFGSIPYELLELNTLDDKHLYLFFDEAFYEIKPVHSKITPLIKITDKKVVKELMAIKGEEVSD
ncbi:MAG: hypothetical protein FVQ77_12865 [Cytophagales bacterium]|nr:hypothetical protein [Cytophagales bacterium]